MKVRVLTKSAYFDLELTDQGVSLAHAPVAGMSNSDFLTIGKTAQGPVYVRKDDLVAITPHEEGQVFHTDVSPFD
jgi:hypothetical protein